MKANLMHLVETNGFTFIESYITPAEMVISDRIIKAGTWLATIEVSDDPEHDWIWDGIKSGKFNGLSIQAMGDVERIEED